MSFVWFIGFIQINETDQSNQPVLALCDNTERPETITIGTNELIGNDPSKLPPALARLIAGQWEKGAIPPKWDGKAAERIVEHLERLLASKSNQLTKPKFERCLNRMEGGPFAGEAEVDKTVGKSQHRLLARGNYPSETTCSHR